jgi:hypothetical protein
MRLAIAGALGDELSGSAVLLEGEGVAEDGDAEVVVPASRGESMLGEGATAMAEAPELL